MWLLDLAAHYREAALRLGRSTPTELPPDIEEQDWSADLDQDALGSPPPSERAAWWAGFVVGLSLLAIMAVLVSAILLVAAGSPPRAVLLFGVDERPDEQQRGQFGHTDTVAVLTLSASRGATLISFPRDLWVDIPDYGPQRLNVAYPVGAQDGGPAGGASLLARTVSREFGLGVDRWARVDFRGFVALVDALGGVDVTVPRTIVDETYPTDDYRTRRLVIPAGRQHFSGDDALAYVRTRAADTDFGRMDRQQQVLVALRDEVTSPAGLVHLPAAVATLPRVLQTNLSPAEALALARTLALLPRDDLHTLVIGPDLAPPATGPGGAAILVPRTAAIRQAIAAILEPPRGRP